MEMNTGIVTGTFDLPTIGHLDIIKRASKLFDRLYVVILLNPEKKACAFSVEERMAFLKALTKDIPNVTVEHYDGLAIDYAKSIGGGVFVRGFRNENDFEYEREMAEWNLRNGDIETILLPAREELKEVSSTTAKELLKAGDAVLVGEDIANMIFKGGN